MDFGATVKTLSDGVLNGDPTIIGVLVALLVGILTIVILACRGGSNKRRGVLLVGLCDSGKTLIFSRLVHKKFFQTYTSTKENGGIYELHGDKTGTLKLVDLPGHERLRPTYLEQYKTLARGIIFVIDSLTFQKEIRDVAQFIYSLLTDKVISNNATPILIACNKQDQALAKGVKVIQAQLEKEMNALRVTQGAALESITGSGNNNTFLGKKGKDFQFSDCKPLKIDFVECSAKGKKSDGDAELSSVEEWLFKIA